MNARLVVFVIVFAFFTFSVVRFFHGNSHSKEFLDSTKIPLTKCNFNRTFFDLGENKVGTPVTARFSLYNAGNHDLQIGSVVPDCHCTVADFPSSLIAPQDSAIIRLRFDGLNPGPFQSSAVVTTNSPGSPTLLIFRGVMVH
jgi:Protein of unknown function (DUF1573)